MAVYYEWFEELVEIYAQQGPLRKSCWVHKKDQPWSEQLETLASGLQRSLVPQPGPLKQRLLEAACNCHIASGQLPNCFRATKCDNKTAELQDDVTPGAVEYFGNLFNQLHALKSNTCAPEVVEGIEALLAAEATLQDLCREAKFRSPQAEQVLRVCYCYITKPYLRTINVSMDLEKLDKLFQTEVFKGLLQTSGCDMYVDIKREDIVNGKFGLHIESACLDDFLDVKHKVEELLEDIETDGGLISPPPIDEDVVNELDRPKLRRRKKTSSTSSESTGDNSEQEEPPADAEDPSNTDSNNNQEESMETEESQASEIPEDVQAVVQELMENLLDRIDGQTSISDTATSHEHEAFAIVSQIVADTVIAACELVSPPTGDNNTPGDSRDVSSNLGDVPGAGSGNHTQPQHETLGASSSRHDDNVSAVMSEPETIENSPSIDISEDSNKPRSNSPDVPTDPQKGELLEKAMEVNNNVDSGPDSGRGESESDQDEAAKQQPSEKPSAFQENTHHLEEQLVQMKINFYHRLLSTDAV